MPSSSHGRLRLLDGVIVAVAVWQQVQIWTTASPGNRWAIVPLSLAFALALLLRDRFPVASRVGAFAALGLWAGFAPHDRGSSASFFVGSMLAFWIAGLTTDRRAATAGLASGLMLVAYAESVFPGGGFGEFLFTVVIQVGVWIAAFVLAQRGRHAQQLQTDLAAAQAEREARVRQAASEERARIARELHDVIAHNLSVAIVQLAAASPDLPEGNPSSGRVRAAENACRQALGEMRRLLGVIGTEHTEPGLAPAPGLASLDELVETTRAAGLDLQLSVHGQATQLPPGIDLAAYRIVQEALTNALKHGDQAARLALSYRPEVIEIEVANRRRADVADVAGDGRGLIGMRERVAVYHGMLEAGPDGNGGFRVAATLPLEAADE